MNPEDLKKAWQTQVPQSSLTIDTKLLLNEVRRNAQAFAATIWMRDFREIGVCVVMLPVWLCMGFMMSLPWTWYLTVPGLLWIACYMLLDRRRHKRRPPEFGDPLRRCVQDLLAEVEHQIRLLRSVLWWYLLPLFLPILVFFCQVTWRVWSLGWLSAISLFAFLFTFEVIVFAGIYWLNQLAVRTGLEPRRQELKTLLTSLEDEPPGVSV